jgi:short-subunit dehydrogenase
MSPVALITGASSGIGAAVARELGRQGYRLVLAARSTDILQQLAGELTRAGTPALPVPTDVSQPDQLQRLVRRAIEHFGQIDVLVNNAGIGETRAFAPGAEGLADLTIHTNLLAPITLSRAVLPHMLARRSGHIINIGSVAGHVALPDNDSYSTSKFGLRGYTQALRRKLLGSGVHVSLVSPGYIRTAMTATVPVPIPGPKVVARAITRLLARPKSEVVVPGYYRFLIWLNKSLPGLIDVGLRLGRKRRW